MTYLFDNVNAPRGAERINGIPYVYSTEVRMYGFWQRIGLAVIVFAALVVAFALGLATPVLAAGPLAQSAPIENSIVPTLVQILLIVLVTQGVNSLLKAFTDGKTVLAGREAAIAYVVVGLIVYVFQTYLIPALPPAVADAVGSVFLVLATLLAGSGLYSMTSAFRVSK